VITETGAGRAPQRILSLPPVEPTDDNPYQRLLYEHLEPHGFRLAGAGRFRLGWLWRSRRDVGWLHFHWPEAYYQDLEAPVALRLPVALVLVVSFSAQLRLARLLGYRIAWTIHQVLPHEMVSRVLALRAARSLARASSVLIAHDRPTADRARAELGGSAREIAIVPHGSYIGVYPPGRSRDDVRAELGISPEAFVFLSFGYLRAYKEVDFLLREFAAADLTDACLVIAGSAKDAEVAEHTRRAALADPAVKALVGFVPNDRVAELFGACDAAVCARIDGGTSGSIVLALSLGTPVVAARLAGYEQLVGSDAAGWLFEPGEGKSLRAALKRAAADRAALGFKRQAALARAAALDWTEIGRSTAELFARAR
jgi:glycosyltransferase involved in cell wall biosynthesis